MTEYQQKATQDIRDMEAIKKVAVERVVKMGEYIFKEGEEDSNFYIVIQGDIEISIKKSDGGDKVLAYVKPGELLGEGVLSGKTYKPASARAIQEAHLLSISHENFNKLITEDPQNGMQFLLKVMGIVNDRLHQSNVRLLALFEISKMMSMHSDDLKTMGSSLIHQLLGLTKSTDGILILKNPYSEGYRVIYSTNPALNENTVAELDLTKPQYLTTSTGHLLIVNLKQVGAIILSRPLTDEAFDEDHSRLLQLVADQAATTIEEASRKAEEKAKTILHQKRIVL